MGSRSRSFNETVPMTGTFRRPSLNPDYTYYRTVLFGPWGSCNDVVGERDQDNPFELDHSSREFPLYSGDYWYNGNLVREVRNYPMSGPSVAIPNPTSKAPVIEDWAELAWQARQFMDPQRGDMSLPQFIGEAGDLPSLLSSIPELLLKRGRQAARAAGRRCRPRPKSLAPNAHPSSVWAAAGRALRGAASDVGGQYVGNRFGWRPVMADLAAMLALAASIAKRLDWLLRLLYGRSIRRRMFLSRHFESVTIPNVLMETAAFSAQGQWTDLYRTRHWCTSRWSANALTGVSMIPDLDDPDGLILLAARLATGMNAKGIWDAWWELLPWSWLIDWWFNIGRLWSALLPGALHLKLDSLCYCRTCTIQRFGTVTTIPGWLEAVGPPIRLARTHKWRKDLMPYLSMDYMRGPALCFPALRPGQWAILAGLLATKVK